MKTRSQLSLPRATMPQLFAGSTLTVGRAAPGAFLYFGILSGLGGGDGASPRPMWHAVVARTTPAVLFNPLAVAKTRAEATGGGSALAHLAGVFKDGAWSRGLVPSLLRDAPQSAVYLWLFEAIRPASPGQSWSSRAAWGVQTLTAAFTGGVVSTAITHPLDVLRTRMQGRAEEAEWGRAVSAMAKEGPYVLFKGLAPRLIRRSLSPAITWGIYAIWENFR
jgi:solute carrier family 25 protein 38